MEKFHKEYLETENLNKHFWLLKFLLEKCRTRERFQYLRVRNSLCDLCKYLNSKLVIGDPMTKVLSFHYKIHICFYFHLVFLQGKKNYG